MGDPPAPADPPENPLLKRVRDRTPARLFVGRTGSSYPTQTALELRRDHAAALDAVQTEVDLNELGAGLIEHYQLFEVGTRASSKPEYLMRPDLGRCLSDPALAEIAARCPRGVTLQVVIGDGLSSAAVVAQVPLLLPLLEAGARSRGWTFGRPFLVRYCRVGVLNDVGERLDPTVVVLLIGERPGLATSESLSAYMAYRPRPGDTDAKRNLVSNVHARGLSPAAAADRVLSLAAAMIRQRVSGVKLLEDRNALAEAPGPKSL